MKKIFCLLSTILIFCYGQSFGQINYGLHPVEIRYCTFPQYVAKPGDPPCISFQCKYVNNSSGDFLNAPGGDYSKATSSNWLAVIYPKWGRVAVFVNKTNRTFEIYTNDNTRDPSTRLLGIQDYFVFVGWDNTVYDITFNSFIGHPPVPPPHYPCTPVMVNNSICNGNACNVVTVMGNPNTQVGGVIFTNNSNCVVTIILRSENLFFNPPCSDPSSYEIQPHAKFGYGINSMTFCPPYEANFKF